MDNCEIADLAGSNQPSSWDQEANAGRTPVGCHGDFTPARTPSGALGDTTPAHTSLDPPEGGTGDEALLGSGDGSDTDSSNQDHNPEPPAELLEKKLIDADNIGNTVFSQHALFSTLMKLIQVVDGHEEDKKASEGLESGLDLDEGLQDELCKLWDMSMNPEVVKFLLDFKTVDILTGVISKSKAPRATEVCVGVLGNMACSEEVMELLTNNSKLITIILLLLENPDAPTLVETTRLLQVCVSGDKTAQPWINAIKEDKSVFTNICFILRSSTNRDLLKNTAELVDKVMDVDEELCRQWSAPSFVLACLEACKQASVENIETVDSLLHALQLVSTCEEGVQALMSYWEETIQMVILYLEHVCSEDIVVIEGQENSLACVLSLLGALFSSLEKSLAMLSTDFQIVRCVFKIFQVIYIKYHNIAHENGDRKHRRVRTTSLGSVRSSVSDHSAADDTSLTPKCTQIEADNKNDTAAVERTASYDASMTNMLYEVLQGLVLDIVSSLSKTATISQPSESPNDNGSTDIEENTDQGPEGENNVTSLALQSCDQVSAQESSCALVPKSLEYLNSMCERARLQYVLYCVLDTRGSQSILAIPRLKIAAEHFRLARLCQIIDETCPSGT